ncbi:MAG TPA: hypothetical protein VKE49_10195, partial [Myxococcaceae bacterium]|nr:hypothetical protein [Myxococcaceae bacterium]
VADAMSAPVSGRTMIFGQAFAAPVPNAAQEAPAPEPATTVKLPPEEPPWAAAARGQRRAGTVELSDAKPLFETAPPETPRMSMGMEEVSSSRRLWVVGLLLIALAIPTLFAARAVLRRRSSVPVEVLSGEESAMTLLRRDDRPSRKQAIADLESLAKRYPSAIGPAATRLLALSLDLDDVRLAVNRLQSQSDELNRFVSRADQRTADGVAQVAAVQSQLAALNKELQPLLDEQKTLDQQVATAFGALMMLSVDRRGGEDATAIRAQAVYYAVKGVDKAEGLARGYRELGTRDGWDGVALAEYALNAQVGSALIGEARAESERSRSTDSAFLRPYVLAARLALLQKDYDAASSLLDAVVALNPAHEMARQLIGWVDEAKRNDTARSAQASGDPAVRRQ